MKKFNELTRLGRIRRARKIVLESLEYYDFTVKKLDFLIEETNIFFKITTQENVKYAIKLYEELSSNYDDSIAEAYFLTEISNHLDIIVPSIVENKNGDVITLIDTEYDDVQKRLAVYTWMDGKDIDEKENTRLFRKIGVIMAKLHKFSKNLQVPKTIKSKKLDKVLYYAGDDYFYRFEKHQSKVTAEFKTFMDDVIPFMDEELSKLYKESPILIHGDFNPWNIKIFKDEVRLLDFEDTSLAYPIHDIAILFFYYQYDEHFEEYKKAFYEGYNQILDLQPCDEETLQLLMMARRVNFMNYMLEVSDDPSKYIETNMKRVKAYLDERKKTK